MGDNRERINHLMTQAFSAFDRLYFHSQTNGDLLASSRAVSKALAEVRYLARTNHQSRQGE